MTDVAASTISAQSHSGALVRYDCRIAHVRRTPLMHRFTYRSPMWLVDVDRVPALPPGLRFLNRFDVGDHWSPGTADLRSGLDAFLASQGAARPARALLLTGARSLGHCFNPLSVWWCFDADGRPTQVVAEVHNTYRGRHAYVLRRGDTGRNTVDPRDTRDSFDALDTVDKQFYVSPFFAAEGRYRMRISDPDERLRVAISLELGGTVPFTATLVGRRQEVGRWGLARRPLSQLRVAALIRFQGVRLWRRGLPVQPRTGSAAVEHAAAGNLIRPGD